jgi:hypothetical protein
VITTEIVSFEVFNETTKRNKIAGGASRRVLKSSTEKALSRTTASAMDSCRFPKCAANFAIARRYEERPDRNTKGILVEVDLLELQTSQVRQFPGRDYL